MSPRRTTRGQASPRRWRGAAARSSHAGREGGPAPAVSDGSSSSTSDADLPKSESSVASGRAGGWSRNYAEAIKRVAETIIEGLEEAGQGPGTRSLLNRQIPYYEDLGCHFPAILNSEYLRDQALAPGDILDYLLREGNLKLVVLGPDDTGKYRPGYLLKVSTPVQTGQYIANFVAARTDPGDGSLCSGPPARGRA